jgi:hypothetical protein
MLRTNLLLGDMETHCNTLILVCTYNLQFVHSLSSSKCFFSVSSVVVRLYNILLNVISREIVFEATIKTKDVIAV